MPGSVVHDVMHDMVNDVVVMTTAVVVEGAAAARATGTTPAAQVLVSAAPGLLGSRPANVPIIEACMAVIWGTHNSMALNGLPGPIAIHLDVLPHHAGARIHRGRRLPFAALTALGAAPLLFLW